MKLKLKLIQPPQAEYFYNTDTNDRGVFTVNISALSDCSAVKFYHMLYMIQINAADIDIFHSVWNVPSAAHCVGIKYR